LEENLDDNDAYARELRGGRQRQPKIDQAGLAAGHLVIEDVATRIFDTEP
jgi:hypothetical protein